MSASSSPVGQNNSLGRIEDDPILNGVMRNLADSFNSAGQMTPEIVGANAGKGIMTALLAGLMTQHHSNEGGTTPAGDGDASKSNSADPATNPTAAKDPEVAPSGTEGAKQNPPAPPTNNPVAAAKPAETTAPEPAKSAPTVRHHKKTVHKAASASTPVATIPIPPVPATSVTETPAGAAEMKPAAPATTYGPLPD